MARGWRWRPLAEADATEIWNWIAADSPDAAMDMLERFEDVARMLAEFPEAGVERSSLMDDLRSFTVAGYILFYRPVRSGIEIVRIIHSRRDITPNLF
jgi:toxin ParE1/3/4